MTGSEPTRARVTHNRLATKLILFVFISTFATALVVSGISIQTTYVSLRGVIQRLYPAALDDLSQQLAPWLESGRVELEQLAAGGASRLSRTIDGALKSSEHFQALGQIDAEGAIVAAVGIGINEIDPAYLRKFAVTSQYALIGPPSADSETGRVAAAVIPLGKSAKAGALVGVFDRDKLEAMLAREVPDGASVVALADERGAILVRAGAIEAHPLIQVDPIALGVRQPGALQEYESSLGVYALGAAQPVGVQEWAAVVEAPFEAASRPVLSAVTRIFVTDLCVILLFSLLAYRITANVVRPIEVLSRVARRIADGETDLDLPESQTSDEIGVLTRAFSDMMSRLRTNQSELEGANRRLLDRNAQLQQANEVLSQLSITDGLTKLHNHRFFQEHLTREIKRVKRTHEPLSILLFDLDDFKRLNDRLGHAAGDELLARLACILNDSVRDSDLLARYGGEEFVVLAANTELRGAYELAEKIRTAISETSFILDDSLRPTRVTVSIGVAQFTGDRKSFFQSADQALYRAKAEGKNCVVAPGLEESAGDGEPA